MIEINPARAALDEAMRDRIQALERELARSLEERQALQAQVRQLAYQLADMTCQWVAAKALAKLPPEG